MDSTVARTAVIATIPVLVTKSDACSVSSAGRIQAQAEHNIRPVAASTAVTGARALAKIGGRDMAWNMAVGECGKRVRKSEDLPDTVRDG
jgi:hypothetical protein